MDFFALFIVTVVHCIAVSCPALTVTNSDTIAVTDATSTGASYMVTCNSGYISSNGSTFSASCDASSPGVSIWSNELTCNEVTHAVIFTLEFPNLDLEDYNEAEVYAMVANSTLHAQITSVTTGSLIISLSASFEDDQSANQFLAELEAGNYQYSLNGDVATVKSMNVK